MIERIAEIARPVLNFPMIRRTRRNHGLEHATINILNTRLQIRRMAGRSSEGGFVLFGDVSTEQVETAVEEALRRMKNGEHRLALHPNCGTNLVASGALTTLAALVGLAGGNKRITVDRLSWVMILMMLAVLFSQPLGMKLQEHITTEGDPGDLEIVSVTRRSVRWPFSSQPVTVHSVITRNG